MAKTRVKWFTLPIDRAKLRALADAMKGSVYTAKRGHGFVLTDVRPTSVSGSHIERTEREVVGTDPFGADIKQTLTVFIHSTFTITTSAPGLEVVDAPRSIKMLLGQISALSQFSLTVTEIEVDPLVWIAQLEKEKLQIQVKELEYVDIAFKGGTTGSLTVRGRSDVREAGQKIVGERPKQVHRLDASITNDALAPTEVTLERYGKALVPSEALTDFRNILCSTLLASQGGNAKKN